MGSWLGHRVEDYNLEPTIIMNNFNKLFSKIALITLVIGAMFSLVSCEKLEDEKLVYYSMGFDSFQSSSSSFLTQMVQIENAFKEELGVTSSTFYLEGTSDECDAQVKEACQRAEESLQDEQFDLSATFVVTNTNNVTVVYTYTVVKD